MRKEDGSFIGQVQNKISDWYFFFGNNILKGKQDEQRVFVASTDAYEGVLMDQNGIPVLEVNRIQDHVRKCLAEVEKQTPQVTVTLENMSVNYLPQKQEAAVEIIEGYLRKSDMDSFNKDVVNKNFQWLICRGHAAMVVSLGFADENSFRQEVKTVLLQGPEMAFFDPLAAMPTRQDGRYAGYFEYMEKADFEKIYPGVKCDGGFPLLPSTVAPFFNWWDSGRNLVTVVHFFEKETKDETIILLNDGTIMSLKDYKDLVDLYVTAVEDLGYKDAEPFFPPQVKKKRSRKRTKIRYYKLCGTKIIEEMEWPSKFLPVVFCDGFAANIDGRPYSPSYVSSAVDAQRILNMALNIMVMCTKNARKEQWLVDVNSIKEASLQQIWKTPHVQQGALPYDSIGDGPIRPNEPRLVTPTPFSPEVMEFYRQAQADLQDALGRYEANAGSDGNEPSAIAIDKRIVQGNMATYVWKCSLDRAVELIGKIKLSMLPKILEDQENIDIVTKDGKNQTIQIDQDLISFISKNIDNFKISVKLGMGYSHENERALAQMNAAIQMVSSTPQGASSYDLIVDKLDIPDKAKFAERLSQFAPQSQQQGPDPALQVKQAELQLKGNELAVKGQELQIKNNDLSLQKEKIEQAREKARIDHEIAMMKAKAEVIKSGDELEAARYNQF